MILHGGHVIPSSEKRALLMPFWGVQETAWFDSYSDACIYVCSLHRRLH